MEHDDHEGHDHSHAQPKPPPRESVKMTPGAQEALEGINLLLRDIGYRVRPEALVEAALVELREQFVERERAVEIVRKRVPPHSVVFPP
jgi:hypothetical protein